MDHGLVVLTPTRTLSVFDAFVLTDVVGDGAYGDVFAGVDAISGAAVAAKIFPAALSRCAEDEVHCARFGGAAGVQDFLGVNRDWLP